MLAAKVPAIDWQAERGRKMHYTVCFESKGWDFDFLVVEEVPDDDDQRPDSDDDSR
jgi:hypothetical protein